MNAIDLMLTRRSAKAATLVPPAPSDEELETILRAATRVPDHGKLTPWRIQVLRPDGQARLGAVLADLFTAQNPDANAKQIAFEADRPQRAPLLMVVTAKLQESKRIPRMEQMLSAGAVCYGLLMATRALGYGANWLTEWPAYRPEVARALGHDPETDQIVGFVYVGTPSETPAERPRPELADIVTEWSGPAAG